MNLSQLHIYSIVNYWAVSSLGLLQIVQMDKSQCFCEEETPVTFLCCSGRGMAGSEDAEG